MSDINNTTEKTVSLKIHEQGAALSAEAEFIIEFWKANLSDITTDRHRYIIHIWDKPNVLYAEAGIIFKKREGLGCVERTIIVMALNKVDKTFPLIVGERDDYFRIFVNNLVSDSVKKISRKCGYFENYLNYDISQFERRFLGSNKMVLAENGERLDDEYNVLEKNGSKIFSLVPPVAVDFII